MVANGEQDCTILLFVILPNKHDAIAVVDRETIAPTQMSFECMHAQLSVIGWVFEKLNLLKRFLLERTLQFLELPSKMRSEVDRDHK